jgi:hypothetical protein
MPNDPFIDIAALPSLGPIRYLDARDPAAFDAGHAPGAVLAPVEEWDAAAKAADTGFNKTAYWDDALGSLGVDPSAIAVAYEWGWLMRRLHPIELRRRQPPPPRADPGPTNSAARRTPRRTARPATLSGSTLSRRYTTSPDRGITARPRAGPICVKRMLIASGARRKRRSRLLTNAASSPAPLWAAPVGFGGG